MTEVLIVEDQAMPRRLFEMFVEHSGRYRLAASITNADMAEYYCERLKVELVLMDICTSMNANGLEAAERIKKRFPEIKVIIVTSMPEYSYLERARRAGVDSFWYKELNDEPIMSLMDRTMAGESIFPDKTPEVRLGHTTSYEFSEAEIRVLRLLVEGMTYKQMAQALGVTTDCVKAHISSMLSKTGFTSKTKLAAVVISKKLIVNGF